MLLSGSTQFVWLPDRDIKDVPGPIKYLSIFNNLRVCFTETPCNYNLFLPPYGRQLYLKRF